MPLIHSKRPAAFKKNIETEMEHGKPQKQALAIAYHVADEAKEHKAGGGMCMACGGMPCKMADGGPLLPGADTAQDSMRKAFHFKDGGEVAEEGDELHDMVGSEMMDAIHSKDHKKMMQGLEAMVLSCMNKRRD